MSDAESRYAAGGVRRAAAMVGALGGTMATLRVPAPPVAHADGEQLGLATPLFSEIPLSPVGLRRRPKETLLLVPATVLEAALQLSGIDDVGEALESAATVTVGDESFAIATVEALQCFGEAYLYRIGCMAART